MIRHGRGPETIEEQLEEFGPFIEVLVRERISDQSLHDDAYQEAMTAAWRRLEEGHPPAIALYKAKQAIIDVARGRSLTGSRKAVQMVKAHVGPLQVSNGEGEEYVIEPSDDRAEQAYSQIEARQALLTALEPLNEAERTLLWERFAEGRRVREIAADEGVTPQAVSLRVKKILAKIVA